MCAKQPDHNNATEPLATGREGAAVPRSGSAHRPKDSAGSAPQTNADSARPTRTSAAASPIASSARCAARAARSTSADGVLVIDQPTEFDRDTADALVAVAEDGQTVIYRYTPIGHTIRMPARFRLMVTTSRDELDSRRHHAASLLDLCDIELTGGMPTDSTMPPERLQAAFPDLPQVHALPGADADVPARGGPSPTSPTAPTSS